MKWLFLIGNLASIACVIGATVAICMGKDGWGWLLFMALMLQYSYHKS